MFGSASCGARPLPPPTTGCPASDSRCGFRPETRTGRHKPFAERVICARHGGVHTAREYLADAIDDSYVGQALPIRGTMPAPTRRWPRWRRVCSGYVARCGCARPPTTPAAQWRRHPPGELVTAAEPLATLLRALVSAAVDVTVGQFRTGDRAGRGAAGADRTWTHTAARAPWPGIARCSNAGGAGISGLPDPAARDLPSPRPQVWRCGPRVRKAVFRPPSHTELCRGKTDRSGNRQAAPSPVPDSCRRSCRQPSRVREELGNGSGLVLRPLGHRLPLPGRNPESSPGRRAARRDSRASDLDE